MRNTRWGDVPSPGADQWRVGGTLHLSARWTGFDEGIPLVSWVVTPPEASIGSVWSRQTSLDIPLDRAGLWTIEWDIGGVVRGRIEHQVN